MIAFVLLAIAASGATTSTSAVPLRRAAVVIGNNDPLPQVDYEKLRYADDDAIRFADFFDSIGIETTLFTTPDVDTAARYPEWAHRALRPLRGELERALGAIDADEIYFVFSGHGSITGSEAYLHLFDGPFTRTDLFELVLKKVRAKRVHVIIDSCNSYFLVNARGERVAVASDEENLDRYGFAGFLTSTSERREVQEWSGYEAGVFSYQL